MQLGLVWVRDEGVHFKGRRELKCEQLKKELEKNICRFTLEEFHAFKITTIDEDGNTSTIADKTINGDQSLWMTDFIKADNTCFRVANDRELRSRGAAKNILNSLSFPHSSTRNSRVSVRSDPGARAGGGARVSNAI